MSDVTESEKISEFEKNSIQRSKTEIEDNLIDQNDKKP